MPDLYSGPEVIVRLNEGPGDRLVVTFTHLSGKPGLDRLGFGETFLAAQNVPALYFISTRDHWWQPEDVDGAVDAVRASGVLSRYRERVGYGSSMGGYGAILFSQALGLERVVAVCPQYSIDPSAVPWETRFERWAAGIDFRRPALETVASRTAEILVVFDPLTADRRHWDALAVMPNASPLKLPFAGHPPLTFLEMMKEVGNFGRDAVRGDLDPRKWAGIRRAKRRGNWAYWLQLATVAHEHKRFRLAVTASHRCLAIDPRKGDAWCILGLSHEALGCTDLAAAALSGAVAVNPRRGIFADHARRLSAKPPAP